MGNGIYKNFLCYRKFEVNMMKLFRNAAVLLLAGLLLFTGCAKKPQQEAGGPSATAASSGITASPAPTRTPGSTVSGDETGAPGDTGAPGSTSAPAGQRRQQWEYRRHLRRGKYRRNRQQYRRYHSALERRGI